MIIATTIAQVRAQVAAWKKEGLTVGLVPTMGYLHEGHASLVDEAVRQCDRVVASDFVNPTQFGPNEDLEAYPRDFDRDCALLEEHGCAMVFHPAVEEMYAPGAATYVEILSVRQDPPHPLPGRVYRCLQAVQHRDPRQGVLRPEGCAAVGHHPPDGAGPVLRHRDRGLPHRPRGRRPGQVLPEHLSERGRALVLSESVFLGQKMVAEGETDANKIVAAMTEHIQAQPLAKIDYVSAVDGVTMDPVDRIAGTVLVAMAVYIGKTRLIDNFIVEGK